MLQRSGDQLGGSMSAEVIGVEHEIVGVWIVEIGVEVLPHEPPASVVVFVDVFRGGGAAEVHFGRDPCDADIARGNQSHVQSARQRVRDEVCGAASEDHVADVCQLEDGLGDLLLQLPERGMQADEFADRGPDLRHAVFRQIFGERCRKAVVFQRSIEQIAVEQHPTSALVREVPIEERHEFLPDCRRSGSRLARERDEGMQCGGRGEVCRSARSAEARVQDGQALVEVSVRSHGARG